MAATPNNAFSSNYHVFINHRGPDNKKSLASVVYQFLEYQGLRVFLDSQELEVGGFLSEKIKDAIRTCPIQIVIFSPNYAASPWCLAELDLMLKTGAKIVPVFYDVQPSDLRHVDKGVYADAFVAYVDKGRYLNNHQEWKDALHNASFISGIVFKTDDDMGILCKNIVDTVLTELKNARQSFKLEVAQYPVGLHEAIQELETTITNSYSLDYTSKGKIIAIVGAAGIGKTTLAKELFNRKRSSFNRSSFLSNVSEAHANKTMAKLQDQLIAQLRLPQSTCCLRRGGGADMIRAQLENWYSPALVILDGINSFEQLQALAVNDFLNHGTLVIITARDKGVVAPFGIRHACYEMKVLDATYGKELLCCHAFRLSCPLNGHEKIVEDYLRISGGLPSTIITLAQHLYRFRGLSISD